MSAPIKKLLIVAQTFPPDEGIGGRRWAKFANELQKSGLEVEVIAADLKFGAKSHWKSEIPDERIFRYPHSFPKALKIAPKSTMEKMAYRLALIRINTKMKGTPYDRAIFDKKGFLKIFKERMEVFSPDTVIVSAPPFNLLHYVAAECAHYPKVKFAADFRDPWMDGALYGYSNLSPADKQEELAKEATVIEKFQWIFAAWPSLQSALKQRYSAESKKIVLLPHGWDATEFGETPAHKTEKKVHLMYGGNLYRGFSRVFMYLSGYAEANLQYIEMFTNTPNRLPQPTPHFHVSKAVESQVFFEKLKTAERLLFLIPKELRNGFPTKLLEYAATGVPLRAVGYSGSLSEMIEAKGLGTFTDIADFHADHSVIFGAEKPYRPDQEWIEAHQLSAISSNLHDFLDGKNTLQ